MLRIVRTIMTTIIEKKKNAWSIHVAAYRVLHPEKSFKEVLQACKSTYVKKTPAPRRSGPPRPNAWMEHLKIYKTEHPKWKDTQTYKQLLVLCKTTYDKKTPTKPPKTPRQVDAGGGGPSDSEKKSVKKRKRQKKNINEDTDQVKKKKKPSEGHEKPIKRNIPKKSVKTNELVVKKDVFEDGSS